MRNMVCERQMMGTWSGGKYQRMEDNLWVPLSLFKKTLKNLWNQK